MNDFRDSDDFYHNSDNFRRDNFNYNKMPPSSFNYEKEKLIPKEYKESKQTVDELVAQIKVLNKRLNDKHAENMRLNSLVDTLRNKLLKYKGLSDQYKEERDELSNKLYTRNISEHESDMIQLSKKRSKDRNIISDTKNNSSSPLSSNTPKREKSTDERDNKSDNLELLTAKMNKIYEVLSNLQTIKADTLNSHNDSNATTINSSRDINSDNDNLRKAYPSEQDMIITETRELDNLQNLVHECRLKLQIKRDNDKRKASLQEELSSLQHALGDSTMHNTHRSKLVSTKDILQRDNNLPNNNHINDKKFFRELNKPSSANDYNVGSFLRSTSTASN